MSDLVSRADDARQALEIGDLVELVRPEHGQPNKGRITDKRGADWFTVYLTNRATVVVQRGELRKLRTRL